MTAAHDDRFVGCLLGLACGDAIGSAVEFLPRDRFAPVTSMQGGGRFALPPGYWTDDTSMALCLAASLLQMRGFDARDQMQRYLRWWREGYLSSTGQCFDIGNTVRQALERYVSSGEPYAGSSDARSAGNGSLMRLAPIAMYYHGAATLAQHAADSSRTTHAAPEAVECCQLYARLLDRALGGAPHEALLSDTGAAYATPNVAALAHGAWRALPRDRIRGSGYCVRSLEAALWCFARTQSYADAVLLAVNLGDDADTTGAIVGQLAGAHYGASGIPAAWRATLHDAVSIEVTARALCAAAHARSRR